MKKKKSPDLFIVTWSDISSRADWVDEEEVDKAAPEVCLTVGWIIRDSPDQIVIADSVTESGDWGGITVIPKSVIKKKKILRGARPQSFLSLAPTVRRAKSRAISASPPTSED